VLSDGGVRYIIVGGVAAGIHGALRTTLDVDVMYARDRDNIARLVGALAPLEPYLRGAPPGLPFRLDEQTVIRGLNFTLTTTLGSLDLLGEVAGGGDFERLTTSAEAVPLGGLECLVGTYLMRVWIDLRSLPRESTDFVGALAVDVEGSSLLITTLERDAPLARARNEQSLGEIIETAREYADGTGPFSYRVTRRGDASRKSRDAGTVLFGSTLGLVLTGSTRAARRARPGPFSLPGR
jgi:hypothetical protein